MFGGGGGGKGVLSIVSVFWGPYYKPGYHKIKLYYRVYTVQNILKS